MCNITELIRTDLRDFTAYSSARNEAQVGDVWLNANELPWNPDCSADPVVLNRYPQQQPEQLIKPFAEYYQVNQQQLLMTRGSDEGIDLLIRLFCQSGQDSIMLSPPTFGMYAVCAKLQGANLVAVPRCGEDLQFNDQDLLANWQSTVKLVFLCSPNNPIGNVIDNQSIVTLCDALLGKSIVVVDEAYILDFGQISQ